ncbi:MAG: hypothetical protein GY751_08165 [Bacteroidetes bacterium]|nr:hypothetical protein [Bacteroidota bacterium]
MPGNRERVFPDSNAIERVLEIWDETASQLDSSKEEKATLWVIPLNGATAYGYPDFYLSDWNNFYTVSDHSAGKAWGCLREEYSDRTNGADPVRKDKEDQMLSPVSVVGEMTITYLESPGRYAW